MNEQADLDRLLTAWLTADAPKGEPEHLLGTVLARTARTRRRSAWRIPERWLPMSAISSRSATVAGVPWRAAGVVALLILALAVATAVYVGTRPRALPAPFGPAANGAIVFGRDGDIVSAADPAASPRTIIGGTDQDALPWLSPLGRRFVFVKGDPATADAALWAADTDGSDPIRLAAVPRIGWVEWSPDEDTVAVLTDGDPSVITMIRADGSGSTTIPTGLESVLDLTWRPDDGRQLLFRGLDKAGDWGIYLVDADGSNIRRLGLDPAFRDEPGYAGDQDAYFQAPIWSPDGRSIVYVMPSRGDPGLQIRLAEVDATGGVGEIRTIGDPARASQFAPMFLPSGTGIIFQQVINGHVSLMEVDLGPGATPRDLHVADGAGFTSLAVSPDGTKVIAIVEPKGEVWLADLASGTSSSLGFVAHDIINWQRTAQ